MSTKNLARTVIEGGRHRRNVWQRRWSNAQERTSERIVSAKVAISAEFDTLVYPKREKVCRGFTDKLGPAERFLVTQTGRPWNKVRSELFARFDIRTTAGRHVLFDHVLRAIEGPHGRVARRFVFFVNRHGILQNEQRRRKPRK